MIAIRDEYQRTNPALHPDIEVLSQDGEKLGAIAAFENESFIIEERFSFPRDFAARYDNIATVVDGRATLRLSKKEVHPWQKYDDGGCGAIDRNETAFGNGRTTTDVDEVRVSIVKEEFEARRTERQIGEVWIRQIVHTELRRFTVPVKREEIVVEHVAADRSTPSSTAFPDATNAVPTHEEAIEVVKRLLVRAEVRVRKETRTEEQPIEGEVRQEDRAVDGDNVRRTSRARLGA
jgi:uncharacterized protein (TIGR02271 family)